MSNSNGNLESAHEYGSVNPGPLFGTRAPEGQNPLEGLPYGEELDAAIRGVLEREPNGIEMHIGAITRSAFGFNKLPKDRFSVFLSTVNADRRIRRLGRGFCWVSKVDCPEAEVAPDSIDQQEAQVVDDNPFGSEKVIDSWSLEHMISIWKRTAPPGSRKPYSRRLPHYKQTADMSPPEVE